MNDVCFENLKAANSLLSYWAKYFKITQHKQLQFFIDMMKNKEKYIEKLPENKKKKFKKDFATMFYAYDVENVLLNQFIHVVPNVIKRLKISQNHVEDYRSEGLLAIRRAIWSYKQHEMNTSFMTYCYKGVLLRLSGEGSKIILRKNRKKNKITALASEICSEKGREDKIMSSAVSREVSGIEKVIESENSEIINNILHQVNLDADEKYLISNYMMRDQIDNNWNNKYLEYYKSKYNKSISKQAVHNKLFKIQRKLWQIYCDKTKTKLNDSRYLFLNNAATRVAAKRSTKQAIS